MGSDATYLLETAWEGVPTVYFSCRHFGVKIQKNQKKFATRWRKHFSLAKVHFVRCLLAFGWKGVGVEVS